MLIRPKFSLVCTLGLLALLFAVASAQETTAAQETNHAGVEGLIERADNLVLRGDCLVAQYYYQNALKLEPENIEAQLGQAKTLACQNAFDAAIEINQAVLGADPDNVTARVQLAEAYVEQHRRDPARYPNRLMDALETINRAERLAPNDANVLNTKGLVLYFLEEYEEARNAFQQAISLASAPESEFTDLDRSTINLNLGKSLVQLGELEQAQLAFQRSVIQNPNNANAHNNLGWVYFQLGNCEQAPFELSQAVALDPTLMDAVSNLGIALFECGQVEAATESLERAIDIGAGLTAPPLYTYLARAYLQQGRTDDAVLRAQQGALLPPRSAEAYYWLGQAYEARGENGDAAEAREAYQQALELNPGYAPAQEALDVLR